MGDFWGLPWPYLGNSVAVSGEFRGRIWGLPCPYLGTSVSVSGDFSWPPMGTLACPPSQQPTDENSVQGDANVPGSETPSVD